MRKGGTVDIRAGVTASGSIGSGGAAALAKSPIATWTVGNDGCRIARQHRRCCRGRGRCRRWRRRAAAPLSAAHWMPLRIHEPPHAALSSHTLPIISELSRPMLAMPTPLPVAAAANTGDVRSVSVAVIRSRRDASEILRHDNLAAKVRMRRPHACIEDRNLYAGGSVRYIPPNRAVGWVSTTDY